MKYAGKSLIALALAALLLGGCGLPTGRDQAAAPASQNIPDTRAIRSKYIGNTFRYSRSEKLFSRYWNQVTPEDAGKWEWCEYRMDDYSWDRGLDKAYNFAVKRGYPFKGHALAFGSQTAGWLDELSSNRERREQIEEWMELNFSRYPEMAYMDVVNEPVNTELYWKEYIGGDGETGWDWVIWCFKKAKVYRDRWAPQCKLLINEYNVINGQKLDEYLDCIKAIQDEDPSLLEGVGVQCHNSNINVSNVDTLLANLSTIAEQTGLPIHLSEFDIYEDDDEDQLQKYKDIFAPLYNHTAVAGITLWGYVKGEMWDEPDNPGDSTWLLQTGRDLAEITERPALVWLRENYLEPKVTLKCEESFTFSFWYWGRRWTLDRNYLYPSSNNNGNALLQSAVLFGTSLTERYQQLQWRMIGKNESDGYVKLKSVLTDRYLRIDNSGDANPKVISSSYPGRVTDWDPYLWRIEPQNDGTVMLKNKACNKYLTAVNPEEVDPTTLPTLACKNLSVVRNKQRWRFEEE